jgi:hypothetical protein
MCIDGIRIVLVLLFGIRANILLCICLLCCFELFIEIKLD